MNQIIELEINEKEKYCHTLDNHEKDETLLHIQEGDSKIASIKLLDYWKNINNGSTSEKYETNDDTHKNHNKTFVTIKLHLSNVLSCNKCVQGNGLLFVGCFLSD